MLCRKCPWGALCQCPPLLPSRGKGTSCPACGLRSTRDQWAVAPGILESTVHKQELYFWNNHGAWLLVWERRKDRCVMRTSSNTRLGCPRWLLLGALCVSGDPPWSLTGGSRDPRYSFEGWACARWPEICPSRHQGHRGEKVSVSSISLCLDPHRSSSKESIACRR